MKIKIKNINRVISLMLAVFLLASFFNFGGISFADLNTDVSTLLVGKSDQDAITIVRKHYSKVYETDNNKEISFSILRDYKLVVYVDSVKNTGNYKGFGDIKNKQLRYLGFTKDGITEVTNPYFDNDVTSSNDLRLKNWQQFNENRNGYLDVRDIQNNHLFTANLYDPIGTSAKELLIDGSNVSIKDILRSKVSPSDLEGLQQYSQIGSPPTLNNEGSVMLMHSTSKGSYYDSFIVGAMNIGDRYITTIKPDRDVYRFTDEESITARVLVTTSIDFSSTLAKVGELYIEDKQRIEFMGQDKVAEYVGATDSFQYIFDITLKRSDYKVGVNNTVSLSSITHLESVFGDVVPKLGEGTLNVVVETGELKANFEIFKGEEKVTDSVFTIGKDVVKEGSETEKETIKRLGLSETLTLDPSLFYDHDLNEVKFYNWFAYNYETSSFDYVSHSELETIDIDKNNVDKYMDEEGSLKFKLFIQDKYGVTSEMEHSTVGKVAYKGEPAVTAQPPNTHVSSSAYMKAGSTTSFSGLKSYDKDGYITDYEFNGYGGFRIININDEGTGGYGSPIDMGNATIRLKVTDDSNLSASDDMNIRVVSPIEHNEVLKGSHKVNRKITLDSTADRGTTYYPSSKFETSWTIEPLEGQDKNSIKWDTDNIGNQVDVLFKEEGIYNIKKTVRAKCTYPGDEDLVIVETIERGIRIYPDEKPIAQFATVRYNLRQTLDNGYATIRLYDTSYSPDADSLYKRTWWYKYDANNDGSFDDEVFQLLDASDKKEVSHRVKDVGRYEFKLSVEEDYTSDTILRFLSPSNILRDDTSDMPSDLKLAEVINVAPVVKLEEKANKRVDMIVISDYTGSDKAELESDIMLLTKNMQEKKLNLVPQMVNVNDEGNSVVVGQVEVPVFHYYRYASLNLYYDEYLSESFSNGRVTRTRPGVLTYGAIFESYNKTENEAKDLPSYPLAYGANQSTGYKFSGSSSTQYYVRRKGGSLDIYDEPNVKRTRVEFPQTLSIFTNSMWGNSGVVDMGTMNYDGATLRRTAASVDKEFRKGDQVGTKLEDLVSIDVEKIKEMNFDENSDKYLVILTNDIDTTKSFDDTFIKYLKDEGFIIRYSVPEIAKEQNALGYKYTDLRFTETSIILKTDNGKYFEIGNSTLTNQKTFPVEVTDQTKKNLFNSAESSEMVKGDPLKVPAPSGYYLTENYYYVMNADDNNNYQKTKYRYLNSTILFENNTLTGHGVNLSNIAKVYEGKGALVVEMIGGGVKVITHESIPTIISVAPSPSLNDYGRERYYDYYVGTTIPNPYGAFTGRNLVITDTSLDKVESISSSDARATSAGGSSRYGGSVPGYAIELWNAITTVRGENGKVIKVSLMPELRGADLRDKQVGYTLNIEKRALTMSVGSKTLIQYIASASLGGLMLDIAEIDSIAYTKAYYKNDMLMYLKNGSLYGKGNSSNGQLGVVAEIPEFEIVSTVKLNDANKTKNFINMNALIINSVSKCFDTKDNTLVSISDDYADYSTDDTIYRLLGEPFEVDNFYFDYESDPLNDYKYDYTHTEIFDNSMGVDPLNGTSTKELVKEYSKVGKYVIKPRYQDNPRNISAFANYWLWNNDNTKINLIVHRRPVAKLRKSYDELASEIFVTIGDGGSYDLDHVSMASKGIVEKELMYKMSTDTVFKSASDPSDSANLSSLDNTIKLKITDSTVYEVVYRVKDIEGAWSEWVNETISIETVTMNEAPKVSFSKVLPSTPYEGDDIDAFILATDPDGDSLSVDYYVAAPGQDYVLIKKYTGVSSGTELKLNKITNAYEGDYRLKVIVSDGEFTAQARKTITLNGITLTATLAPHDPMAGDMLYFDVEATGYVDKVEIILEDDMVYRDERIRMGYNGVNYKGNSLIVNIDPRDVKLTNIVHHEYIAWCTIPQSLTLKKVRNRAPYKFIVKAYRGEHVSDEFLIERDIEGDVRQLLKITIKK
ncbi:MAG: hypothetical protein WBA54_01720 [Acidaminobacteraceae bacterium]